MPNVLARIPAMLSSPLRRLRSGQGRWPTVLAIGLAAVLSATFLALYLMLTRHGQRDSIAESRRMVTAVAASLTDQLSRALETTDMVLLDMAASHVDGEAPWDAARTGLRLRELPHLRALLVTDSLGRIRHATVEGLAGTVLADRPWLYHVAGSGARLVVGKPEAGRFLGEPGRSVQETRRWTIPLARPIATLDGGMQGAALALLNPAFLSAMGQRMAQAFGVTVRFHSIDGALLAKSDGRPEGIGQRNPEAWLFRDFLPRRDSGTGLGPDSAGIASVSSFGVASPGLIVVEVSQPMARVLAPARERALQLGLGIGGVALSTLVTLGLFIAFTRAAGRRQKAMQKAELLRVAAEREAEALRQGRKEVERLHAGLPAIIFLCEVLPDGTPRRIYNGGDTEAVTGWPSDALIRLDDWASFAAPGTPHGEAYARFVQEGHTTLDWQMRRPDGSLTWVRTTGRLLERRPDGSMLGVGYVLNIDAERRAAEHRAAAQRELERTLAAAPLAVFRAGVAPDGSFTRTYLSQGITRLTGWPWERVNAPGGLHAILEPDTQDRVQSNMQALLRTGETRAVYRIRRADGTWMWARTTMVVLEHQAEGGAEVVGYIADITAEREAEAKALAAARLASLGEMTSGLAHELMQPLLTMSLAAENASRALGRGEVDAARPRLERITQQVLRAKKLVNHFRRFARGTPEGASLEPVDLAEAVEGALVLVGAGLREAGIDVEVALGEPPPCILGHALPLEQVLVNLLRNARDAMLDLPPEAPRRIRVAVGPAREPGRVTLSVSDTGGGIPDAVMSRLFEPFVSTKGLDHGTGLGLSICHRMVKAMGGSIEARNDSAGAVFTIVVQAAPAQDDAGPAGDAPD